MTKDNTNKTRVQAIPRINIPHYANVNYMQLGSRHAEVVYMQSKPKANIKKLSKNTYKILSTGEVKEYKPHEGKQIPIIKKSMRRLEQLIKANFDTVGNADNALFVTLTYKGAKMKDFDQLYDDFEDFFKRLKYEHRKHKLDYIAVAEPHASGGWHMHMLVKSDQPVLFIDNKDMTRIWRHGRTTTVRLKSDDCGAYYTAYFSNVEAPIEDDMAKGHPKDDFTFTKDEETGKQKRFKKGDRLRFYPKHMKFYRCSRGIVRPVKEQIPYSEVPKAMGKPKRTSTYEIVKTYDDKQYFDEISLEEVRGSVIKSLNVIQREIYKKPT